jgi:hypothetical protein
VGGQIAAGHGGAGWRRDFGDQASARRVDSEPVLRALELICRMFMVLLLVFG